MSLDRARVKEIFTAAVELARGELDPYLDEACAGDDELRRELESLLAHHDERDLVRPPLPEHSAPTLVPEERGLASAHEHVRYRELDELGVGGCGRVTSTWDRQLRRRVARKQLLIDAPGQRAMLLQEARLLAWLDHPGVVPVYDTEADGEASYTMRLLDGETLRSRIDSEGQLSIPESVRVLTRVSETMANAHAKGVLHLDLKPANLMLLPFGQVCVLDWGVAKFHDLDAYHAYLRTSGETASPAVAAYDGIAGTPSYMPVEQVVGDALSPATDIYAVGIVLYEMLVGRLPHAASGGARSIIHTLSEAIAPPTRFRADIPERLEALCLRMLASNPADRPASFTEVLAEVDGLHGVPVGAELVLQPGEVLFR
ncbi:MAG: serine/threonine protein kinase, partial [Myxococcales bacterium]|nr:serine/threonine protein kinase [Myxococcales bacterium]